ncbi:MAG: hypothetical protein HY684_07130 [Chloroflexi bacterium]|nr:hypothetical protein [Chloroflexota bacterium]
MRASLVAEKLGIRSVSIVASGGFAQLARRTAQVMGVRHLGLAEYPGVIMTDSKEDLRRKVETLVDQVVNGLATSLQVETGPAEPGPRDIIFAGSLDEVQEFFTRNLWTDGLPVVPPTIARTESFLRFTDRSPEDVIGVVGTENREATVWNVAVNGVMAGCRPEYMPILVAVVEAIADTDFRVHESGGTPGWEPLVILNGPIVKELDFNYECGVMRVGRQANSSIGRFLRLYMRNVAGLLTPPGTTDRGTIGYTFNVVLPENEDAVAALGWPPFSVDRGFCKGENVVTVQSARTITAPIYCGGNTAQEAVEAIAEILGPTCSYTAYLGLRHRNFHPLLVMSPSIAKVLAKDGWTKDDVRDYLYEHARISVKQMEKWAWRTGHTDFSVSRLAAAGKIPSHYCESDDPDRLVPVFWRADSIGIVVAGDPDRNQARGYVHNHRPPASKKVSLPAKWTSLVREYRSSMP